MFKNLKISTGIMCLISVLSAFIIIVSGISFYAAKRSNNNYKEVVDVAAYVANMQNAIYDLNSAAGMGVSLDLKANMSHQVDRQRLELVRQGLGRAKAQMKEFMSPPFLSPEEENAATALSKDFNAFADYTNDRIDILERTGASADIDKLMQSASLRDAVADDLDNYNKVLSDVWAMHLHETDSNLHQITTICIIIVLLAAAMVMGAYVWLKNSLFNRLDYAKRAFGTIAGGDLATTIVITSNNEIGQMLSEVEKMRQSLTETVFDIRHGVTSIYGNAQEIASSNSDLSSRTEEQASALQQTAASMEELKITVRQNADNAHSAKQLVESANTSARKGGEVMVNLDAIMREITDNSRQIADINGVIDSIANQTNILALNAAVEAARAGEQGRGFAVVAGEVRNLAKRSADAAKEIRQLINVCVTNMNTGSQEVELAGSSMKEIVKSVTQVTDIMAEITSASDEQSTGISQIAQAINEMDLVTQQNAGMVQQAATVAQSMENSAQELERSVSLFKLQTVGKNRGVSEMKYTVKTASTKSTAQSESASGKSKAVETWESF